MRVLKLLFLLVLISYDSNTELFSIESIRDFSISPKEKNIDNEITDILMVDLKEYVFVKVDKSQKVAKISLEELQIIYEKYYKKVNAYTIALSGGKHSGWLKNMEKLSKKEIEKSISSMEKNIVEHSNLIKDPKKYLKEYGKGNWDELHPKQKENLIKNKWPKDVERAKEQINILKELKKNKE